MKLYFAAPLFSQAEKEFNLILTNKIEQTNITVFLPQRDGVEKNKLPYNKLSDVDRRKAMFDLDRDHVFNCDIFLFILDGRVPDEGASVELGMAYTHQYFKNKDKLIIGLQTDNRAAFLKAKLNPMLKLSFNRIFDNSVELIEYLKQISSKNNH